MLRLVTYLLLLAALSSGSDEEVQLQSFLSARSSRLVRPAQSTDSTVKIGVSLRVVDFQLDDALMQATFSGWLSVTWRDYRLDWSNVRNLASISRTRLNMLFRVWTPDIVHLNKLSKDYSVIAFGHKWALVDRSGNIMLKAPVVLQVRCFHRRPLMDCPIRLASWTYSSAEVDLQPTSDVVDTSGCSPSSGWMTYTSSVVRKELVDACCPEPFPALEANVTLARPSFIATH